MSTIEDLENKGISVILGSYNRKKYLKIAINSIREEISKSLLPSEIIVIDGGSNDGSLEWLIQQKDIITITQYNRGEWHRTTINQRSWGYFMNLGFKNAKGKYILMISDDCIILPDSLINGYNQFELSLKREKMIGAIPFFFRNWPEMKEYVIFKFYDVINLNHGLYLNLALTKIGFADEKTYQFYYGDVDISFKLHKEGYIILPANNSFIEHHSHANIKTRNSNNSYFHDDENKFIQKWRSDPIMCRYLDNPERGLIIQEYSDPHHSSKRFQKTMVEKIIDYFS